MVRWIGRAALVMLGIIGLVLVVIGTWFLIDVSVLPRMISEVGGKVIPVPTATLPLVKLSATSTPWAMLPTPIPATIEPTRLASQTPSSSATQIPFASVTSSPSPTLSPTPGATNANLVCPNTYPTQLKKGIRVYANLYPNLPSRIREQATTRAKIVGMISPGEEADVLDGPACAEGWIWWKIKKDNGLTGWTAEGDGKDYWILPKK